MSGSVGVTGRSARRLGKVGRILLPFVGFVAYVALELPILLATGLVTGTTDPFRFLLITGPSQVVDSFVVVFVFYRLVAHGSWRALRIGISGLRWLLPGLGAGTGAMLLVVAANLAMGQLHLGGPRQVAGSMAALALGGLAGALATGVSEELMFRGYLLQAFGEAMPVWLAVVLSSALFALVHAGSEPLALGDVFLGGALLCLLRLWSGSLWLGIGFHTAWNFVEGALGSSRIGLLNSHGVAASDLEASGAGVVLVALLVLLIVVWSHLRRPRLDWPGRMRSDGEAPIRQPG